MRTAAAVDKARQKFRVLVERACGGADQTCAPASQDDVPLADIGWNIGSCDATGSTVGVDPIADCGDVASCVDCVQTHAID